MATPSRPEPMNATTTHSKVKVSISLNNALVVAGDVCSGMMEMECRADSGLGLNIMKVELFARQELISRDHSATSQFLYAQKVFQGGARYRPSNAVYDHPDPKHEVLPEGYFTARKGKSTFPFQLPIPHTSPASISFGGKGMAKVHYEIRASVQVYWKDKKSIVTHASEVVVVESFDEVAHRKNGETEGTVVAENGKIWIQGKVVGGILVAGESACVEFQVKNHSNKKNSSLSLSLTRTLHLHADSAISDADSKPPLKLSDTVAEVSFKGPEYVIPPGVEGVASLVFDVPRDARGVKGGMLLGAPNKSGNPEVTKALFEIRCIVEVRMGMGLGNKDIILEIPVVVVHPAALPPPQPQHPIHMDPYYHAPQQYLDLAHSPAPYGYPTTVSPAPYLDPARNLVWLPPVSNTPQPYGSSTPQPYGYYPEPYYYPPVPGYIQPQRTSSRGGLPPVSPQPQYAQHLGLPGLGEPEEGQGLRASRVAQHLRQSSRNRSVSPVGHRFPLPPPTPARTLPVPPVIPVSTIPVPPVIPVDAPAVSMTLGNLAPPTMEDILSPRPLLSPKSSTSLHSFDFVDANTNQVVRGPLPKSDRVEDLERMAEVLVESGETKETPRKSKKDSSAVGKKKGKKEKKSKSKREEIVEEDVKEAPNQEIVDPEPDINKTLPGPPVPSTKEPVEIVRPRADVYFATEAVVEAKTIMPSPAETPQTPTLSPAKHRSTDLKPNLGLGFGLGRESGLDALERRLLAEVGTRKAESGSRAPDVRDVLGVESTTTRSQPIAIPAKETDSLNDSAISSLTLADQLAVAEVEEEEMSDGKTRKGGARSKSSNLTDTERDKDKERKSRKKEKERKESPAQMRKAAKGRIAAWLGTVDPDESPLDDSISPSPSPEEREPEPAEEPRPSVITPNPRSSGFVPINTFKRDTFVRALAAKPAVGSPADEADRVADLWSKSPMVSREAKKALAIGDTLAHNPWQANKASPRLDKFPLNNVDSEVKYDVRSARGGRGGLVTAVKAIWANGIPEEAMTTTTTTTTTKPVLASKSSLASKPVVTTTTIKPVATTSPAAKYSLAASKPAVGTKPAVGPKPVSSKPNLVKSSSVPAIVSSSHAIPTLSSTASLARPVVALSFTRPPAKPTPAKKPAVLSAVPEVSASDSAASSAKKPEMAFGQAKLRDLIKKYQGGG
ncbi:hypothetical protein C8J56DRAFT_813096 [Mycena floridula]|nr:hypothetical protein C8J56DRAFT_813096 [Mycena floridula]